MPAKSLASLPPPSLPGKGQRCLRRRSCCSAPRSPSGRARRHPRRWLRRRPPRRRLPRPPHGTGARRSHAPDPEAFTPAQRKEIEAIIKDILVNNPEVLLEAQNALEAKMDKIQADRMAVAIKEHAGELSARPPRRWSATSRATCR